MLQSIRFKTLVTEQFIVNVTPCFLLAVQFSLGLLCLALIVPKIKCLFLKTLPSYLEM